MSKISLEGNVSGSGTLTIAAPNTNSNFTLTLPTNSGTIITGTLPDGDLVGTTATQTLTNKSIVATQLTGTIAAARLPAGSVLQVVQATYSTQTTTTSTSYETTGLSASITPSSASNKVLIICITHNATTNASASGIFTLFRGTVSGTDLGSGGEGFGSVYSGGGSARGMISIDYLDSPSTTSSQTYTLGFRSGAGGNTQTTQFNGTKAVMILMEIAA
jgi:hypothetical protein